MTAKIRRILLILAATSGITMTTSIAAEAVRIANHCEAALRTNSHPNRPKDARVP